MPQNSNKPSPPWLKYKLGDINSRGEKILYIHRCTDKAIIYAVEGKHPLTWELDRDLCPNADEAISTFLNITVRAESLLKNKKKYTDAYNLIVSDFANALNANLNASDSKYFEESRLYLDNTRDDITHFRYIIIAFSITILSIVPPIIYAILYGKNDIYQILVGNSFGSIGAFVSILQRFNTIPIRKYSTWRFTIIRAISRIFIGAIFGSLIIVAHKSGIILNLLNANTFLLYLFSFISGLSERYFPDILTTVSNKTNVEDLQIENNN